MRTHFGVGCSLLVFPGAMFFNFLKFLKWFGSAVLRTCLVVLPQSGVRASVVSTTGLLCFLRTHRVLVNPFHRFILYFPDDQWGTPVPLFTAASFLNYFYVRCFLTSVCTLYYFLTFQAHSETLRQFPSVTHVLSSLPLPP